MIHIQTENFNVDEQYQQLAQHPQAGAIVFFVGSVRDMNEHQPVSELFLEHYPKMTDQVLQGLVKEAYKRWSLVDIRIIHRIGLLKVNEQIVFVGVGAHHRRDAFEAAEFLMDQLKTKAPFWKKETRLGQSHWLDQRDCDQNAVKRWSH
ncbi:MAG: Molybdopterin synthase catalytic subunit [Candidatus Celerinatantimonas neptuna]|nr:MAG: Molybdopterin synthase catalytic subunit [Candidatus Celerinatantimonas neptuna]